MIDKVFNALSVLNIPVQWQLRPKDFPSITFSFINSSGSEYSEGEEIATSHTLQVDVWSQSDYATIVKNVKDELKKISFKRTFETDDFEVELNVYHKIIRFSYLEGKEG